MRSRKADRKSRRKSKRKMRGGNYAGGNHIFSCVGSRKISKTGCGHMQHGGLAKLNLINGAGVLNSPLLTYDYVPSNLNKPTSRPLNGFPKTFKSTFGGGANPGTYSNPSKSSTGDNSGNHPYLQGGRRKSKRFIKKKSRRKSSKRRTRRHRGGGKAFIDGLPESIKGTIRRGGDIANTNGYSVGVTPLIPEQSWLASTPAPIQAYNNCSQKVLK